MSHNSKELRKSEKNAKKIPAKTDPFGKDVSTYGYRDDSPFRNSPSLNIFTKNGVIDMSNTGIPIMANGRFLPPYSGMHQFEPGIVREQRIPTAQKGRTLKSKIPVIEDAGNYNEEGIWIPDWESMTAQAKKLGAKEVKTKNGSLINFDDKWEVTGVDDNPENDNPQTDTDTDYKMKRALELGYIPVGQYPSFKNEDGSYSNEVSRGMNVEGQEMLLPSFWDGQRHNDDETEARYRKTGEHLGKFNTVADSERAAKLREFMNNEVHPYSKKMGGWLDKYQTKGEVKGSSEFDRLSNINFSSLYKTKPSGSKVKPIINSVKPVTPVKGSDLRQIPQSGIVVDKRTNQAYYFGDKGETGNFPVLTGQNPKANSNPYTVNYLSKHPEARGTPSGYYIMNKLGTMHPSITKEYDERIRKIDGIPAFGVPKPDVKNLAAHWTYGFHDNPKEFKRREALYDCKNADPRWASYGCVNMEKSSFDALAKAVPTADTMMVIDSKNVADKLLLEKAKSRMSKTKKEEGGWLDKYDDNYQNGGETSIVNFLAHKGINYSKENRAKIAKTFGVTDYDYSAKKNLELLGKLKASEKDIAKAPVPVTKAQAKPQVDFFMPSMKKMSSETTQVKKPKIRTEKELNDPTKTKLMKQLMYNKPADMVRATEEQGVMSKAWDIATHPFTAATNLVKHGRIPDHFTQGEQNYMDIAGDVLNPFFYANALGKTADNLTDAKTYTDIPKAIGAGLINLVGDQAPDDWNEAGLSTLGKVGDAAAGLQGLQFAKNIPIAYRNNKYNNTLTLGKGADKKVFNNSIEWMKSYQDEIAAMGKARPLLKKEINFLNKEIKQRGILETQRRHPLNPLSKASKALIVPEDYNFGAVLKSLPKNAWETLKHGTPEANYTMGHGRTAGWNNYLGIPTKENPYRIHPESFTGGKNLTYTIPDAELEKLQGAFNEQIMPKQGIRELLINKEGVSKSKAFNEKAYDIIAKHYKKVGWNKEMISAELGPKSKFKYNPKTDPNTPGWSNAETPDMYRTGDWDRYAGSHGGVGWKAEKIPGSKDTRWTMEDTWDINPFSRKENLPKFIQNFNAGKLLGGKDYHTQLDYIVSPTGHKITPMIPKEYGGSTEFEEMDNIPMAQVGHVAGSWLPPQLRQKPDSGPPKMVDKRKLPQSGVVVDKRTNQAYYVGDKGETGTFPVLTGQNSEGNVNVKGIGYSEEHPEVRTTPTGYYRLPKQLSTPSADNMDHYKGKIRFMMPIPAFGVPAPQASDLAFHRTYNEPGDPKVFKNREKKYSCGPGQRWGSYGCINAQDSSYDALNKAIPNADTLMVIDSKYAADQALLKQMQERMKELGGSTEFEEMDDYRRGGSTNPLMLPRSKRSKTSKNIRSSINKIFLRNYTIFGPGGKNIYDHKSKFEEGGSNWLEKYK